HGAIPFARAPLTTFARTGVVAQFIRICRWLQLIYKDRLAPLENAPFSTPWARKRYSVAQRFRQDLRATNCYKLSGQNQPAQYGKVHDVRLSTFLFARMCDRTAFCWY